MGLDRRSVLMGSTLLAAIAGRLIGRPARAAEGPFPVAMSDADWRSRLDPRAYDVLRHEGTERPYSSPLNHEHRPGRFSCAGCATSLFSSDTKFDSHTGWPSFWQPLAGAVGESRDGSLGMMRTEVHCATCGGHLGHVFNDGPRPTGLRYCMNGAAMRFTPRVGLRLVAMDDGDIASAILAAGDAARSVSPFTDTLPGFDLAQAYRVAAEVALRREARGERILGWKVGFTNTTIWDRYGVHAPIWAPVYDTTLDGVDHAGETLRCDLAGLCEPRIEPEVMLRFARAPKPGMDEGEILACVDAVAHGFEIVQSIYPGWRFRAPDTVAAFGLHGRLRRGPLVAVGADRDHWRRDLAGFTVGLARDGTVVDEGTAANVLGGPLSACRHFLDGLAREGGYRRGVEAGDLVTTGTVTDAHAVAARETWTSRIAGLDVPGMSIAFA